MDVQDRCFLKAAYSEIDKIVSATVQVDPHPFKVGETYTVQVWSSTENRRIEKEYRAVSYTHLDVYKRQRLYLRGKY